MNLFRGTETSLLVEAQWDYKVIPHVSADDKVIKESQCAQLRGGWRGERDLNPRDVTITGLAIQRLTGT